VEGVNTISCATTDHADRCIDPGVHRFSYDRIGATVSEIEGSSHVATVSPPKEVAEVVMTAVGATAMQPA
jgi:hypothetical protein